VDAQERQVAESPNQEGANGKNPAWVAIVLPQASSKTPRAALGA
jgi:hypothetical protein